MAQQKNKAYRQYKSIRTQCEYNVYKVVRNEGKNAIKNKKQRNILRKVLRRKRKRLIRSTKESLKIRKK